MFGRRAFLVWTGSACLLALGMPPATGGKVDLPAQTQEQLGRTLTFAERPLINTRSKRSIGDTGSGRKRIPSRNLHWMQLSRSARSNRKSKSTCANRNLSQMDGDRPLLRFELQTEMDRMASHTRQPEMLRELFAALGNDPFVIAECLARPILAERLVRQDKGELNPEPISGLDGTPNREAITNSWPSAHATVAYAAPKAFREHAGQST